MDDPNSRFFKAKLKHVWAQRHIDILREMWAEYLNSDFCKVWIEDNTNGSQTLKVAPADPFPAQFVLTMGDAVHNLKCALDYTVSEILGWRDTRLTFPMHETRDNLIDAFRTTPIPKGTKTIPKGAFAPVEESAIGLGEFICDTIRPYKGGNDLLWALNKLDGRDKHRLLLPIIVPQQIPSIYAEDEHGHSIKNLSVMLKGWGEIPLMGLNIGRNWKIQEHGKPTAEVFFNEPGIIERQPVIDTLDKMSHAVIETIGGIDEFLTSTGWVKPVS